MKSHLTLPFLLVFTPYPSFINKRPSVFYGLHIVNIKCWGVRFLKYHKIIYSSKSTSNLTGCLVRSIAYEKRVSEKFLTLSLVSFLEICKGLVSLIYKTFSDDDNYGFRFRGFCKIRSLLRRPPGEDLEETKISTKIQV